MDDSTRTKLVKSRHGCGACRKKRMKCDEAKPTCQNCAYRKIECPGYARDLKWSTKYERFKPTKEKAAARRSASPLQSQFQQVLQAISGPQVVEVAQTPSTTASLTVSERVDCKEATTDGPAPDGDNDPSTPACNLQDEQTMALDDPWSPVDSKDSEAKGQIDVLDPIAAHDESTTCVHDHSGNYVRPGLAQQEEYCDHTVVEGDALEKSETRLITSSGFRFCQDWTRSLSPAIHVSLGYEDDSPELLLHHYFTSACRIMSCYDSRTNPYRTSIPDLQHSSTHIRACMMGMSASHMANFRSNMAMTAVRYQTEAVEEIAALLPIQKFSGRSSNGPVSTYEMLLGTIILGMTSAWYSPTANATASGMHHLRGARLLFQTWAADQAMVNADGTARVLDRTESFVIGSMAYWECLSSFIADQSLDAIAYLAPFTETVEGQTIYPNPWTGVSTPIFIRVAQVGILLRQKRILDKLSCIRKSSYVGEVLVEALQQEARIVLDAVMTYDLPSDESMEDTGDPITPLQHLRDVALVYRLTAILELYQAFPALAAHSVDPFQVEHNIFLNDTAISDTIFDLASGITSIVAALPRDSGTYTVLCIALICAGGAMQPHHVQHLDVPGSPEDELARIRRGRPALEDLRVALKAQIVHTSRRLGLAAVQSAAKLVQEVWSQSDARAEMGGDIALQRVHWMDVMMEMRLETLFG